MVVSAETSNFALPLIEKVDPGSNTSVAVPVIEVLPLILKFPLK